ncbi:UNVERIFIED_CONTAM: hypothetical protein HDU68_001072 [Siphonaria sp. JEL0065]|nr:hypothetical protein HDU68_001072 [Siphonaria sp. JEL0065]
MPPNWNPTIATSRKAQWICTAVIVAIVVVVFSLLVVEFKRVQDESNEPSWSYQDANPIQLPPLNSPVLEGCYDSEGNVFSLFDSLSSPVNQSSDQCKAVLSIATQLGFRNPTVHTQCTQNTTFTSPSDPTSLLEARFCDPNTVAFLGIRNPPITLDTIPSALSTLSNLYIIALNNAVYGSNVLGDLFAVLKESTYFALLDVSGTVENKDVKTRVLTGLIPELPNELYLSKYFVHIFMQNNNLTGSIPSTLSDVMARITNSGSGANGPSGGHGPDSGSINDSKGSGYNPIQITALVLGIFLIVLAAFIVWMRLKNLKARNLDSTTTTTVRQPEEEEFELLRCDEGCRLPAYDPRLPEYPNEEGGGGKENKEGK